MKNVKTVKNLSITNSDSEQSETEEESFNDSEKPIKYKNLFNEIVDILDTIILNNKKNKKSHKESSPFFNENIPTISLYDYLLRIRKYSRIGSSTFIISLIYIDRICIKKGIVLSKYNIHRLLFTSILVAIKYNEDTTYEYLYYSEIAGVTVKELSTLEKTFLKLIDFELFVPEKVYKKYYTFLYFNNKLKE
jgi:hypothetical protein